MDLHGRTSIGCCLHEFVSLVLHNINKQLGLLIGKVCMGEREKRVKNLLHWLFEFVEQIEYLLLKVCAILVEFKKTRVKKL